jgi:hypothetical protein
MFIVLWKLMPQKILVEELLFNSNLWYLYGEEWIKIPIFLISLKSSSKTP